MPLYDYRCPIHGDWEDLAPAFKAAAPASCPQCALASPRIYRPPAKHRVSFRAEYHHGAGRHFNTKREFHTWCDETGTGIKTNSGVVTYG